MCEQERRDEEKGKERKWKERVRYGTSRVVVRTVRTQRGSEIVVVCVYQ